MASKLLRKSWGLAKRMKLIRDNSSKLEHVLCKDGLKATS